MDRVILYEEFRLIERNENELNVGWKGAHLLLFFLAFVFGSFCTFCFHILMYMFDQKCVLFPKIVKHTSLRHVVYEYFSIKAEANDDKSSDLPVDFLSTQWVENSVCYLPTYVPLVSGLFGLVWTTMFLMCSSSTSNPTGMQRQWRALPVIFIFSIAMGGLCIYSSMITHNGLQDLCAKLAEVTGSSSCTFTVNVATLAYKRRIRGVYQATRLTILTAWLHTACWLLSVLLTLIRVLFAVDFELVSVRAELIGDVDRMLEIYERQIRSVSSSSTEHDVSKFTLPGRDRTGKATTNMQDDRTENRFYTGKNNYYGGRTDTIFISQVPEHRSEMSLVPEERYKIARQLAFDAVPRNHHFLVKMLYDLLENMTLPESTDLETSSELFTDAPVISRQMGQENIAETLTFFERLSPEQAEELVLEIKKSVLGKLNRQFSSTFAWTVDEEASVHPEESSFNLTPELKETLEAKRKQYEPGEAETSKPSTSKEYIKKSNLKSKGIQTSVGHKVQILDTVPSKSDEIIEDNVKTEANMTTRDEETSKSKGTTDTDETTEGQAIFKDKDSRGARDNNNKDKNTKSKDKKDKKNKATQTKKKEKQD